MPPKITEKELQESTAKYLRLLGPSGRRLKFIAFHVPNVGGPGKSHRIRGAQMYAQGAMAGVADWLFLVQGGLCCAIELKVGKGRLSSKQLDFQESCLELGVPYAVCRSLEDFQFQLKEWGLIW